MVTEYVSVVNMAVRGPSADGGLGSWAWGALLKTCNPAGLVHALSPNRVQYSMCNQQFDQWQRQRQR